MEMEMEMEAGSTPYLQVPTSSRGRPPNVESTLPSSPAAASRGLILTTLDNDDTCLLQHPIDPSGQSSKSFARGLPKKSSFSSTPLLADLIHLGAARLPKIIFRGCSMLGVGWESWVKDMACDKELVGAWRKAGIEDAIMGSTTNVKLDHRAMEALCCFWCPATCTFVFPWGEAAFTLEDAHVLGNLPVWGSQIDRELTDEENDLRLRLVVEVEKIKELHPKVKSTKKKVRLDVWLQWFLELRGERELRHLGFLVYWLARNVIPPYPLGEVPSIIFGLAARLSRGVRIGLAPIVTANIYHDLSKITSSALIKQSSSRGVKVEVWAPFGLIQAWVWERFECLRPVTQLLVPSNSRARISRWDNRRRVTQHDEAVRIFQDERSYIWRPYSNNSGNWAEPLWYVGEPRTISTENDMPDWLCDFAAVISASTLQGYYGDAVISSERYQPHRVARQFGYDQGTPIFNDPRASIWIGKSMCHVGSEVHIPGITRCGNRRGDYTEWWRKHRANYQKVVREHAMAAHPAREVTKAGNKAKNKDIVIALGHTRTSLETFCKQKEKKELGEFKQGEAQTDSLTEAQKVNIAGRKRKFDKKVEDTSRKRDISTTADSHKDVVDLDVEQRRLVDELEKFQRCGLLSEWEPITPEHDPEDNVKRYCSKHATKSEDIYGQEAIRMYPRFFELIPQKPHYRGLLDASVSEEIRSDVYASKWYRLVDLMRKALKTSCQTHVSEIDNLMVEARKFEGLGFNVKHIIARLKEPHARLRRLNEAKSKLEEARSRHQHAREMENLKEQVHDLGSKLRVIEKRLVESQDLIGLRQQHNLKKDVEAAETYLRSMEHEVKAMTSKIWNPN